MISIISTKQELQTYRAIIIDDNSPMFTITSNIINSNPKAAFTRQVSSQAFEHTPLYVQVSKDV